MRSTMKKKIKDSFVEVSISGIEWLFLEMVGLSMWWMGLNYYQTHKDYMIEGYK